MAVEVAETCVYKTLIAYLDRIYQRYIHVSTYTSVRVVQCEPSFTHKPARGPCTHAHYPPDTLACAGAALNARLRAMPVTTRGPAESAACKQ